MAIDFTAKLGPLPVYGWGIIGGGIVAVGAYLLNRGGGTEVSSATLSSDGYQTSGIKMSSEETETPQTYDTNTSWLNRTARSLAAELGKSFIDVQNALWKYLRGETLTETERGIVDTAISRGGTPPEGVEGASTVTPDPQKRKLKYYRTSSSTGRIYALYDNMTFREVSLAEWKSLGKPSAPKTNPKNITSRYKLVP